MEQTPTIKIEKTPTIKIEKGEKESEKKKMKMMRRRIAILSVNKELQLLYEQFVKGGLISEEDFWESKKDYLIKQKSLEKSKRQGNPTSFLSNIKRFFLFFL